MQRGTAVHGQFIESMPEAAALEQGREALAACARWLSSQKLFGTTLGAACSAARAPAGGYCSGQDKYRSLDGSCNHLEQPAWAQGQALTAYRRLLHPPPPRAQEGPGAAVGAPVNTGTALTCCRPDATPLAPRHAHPLCQPVTIPQDDPFYGRVRARCMSYIRSLHAFRPDCGFGPAEQMNQATHFLDGSQLYGTSARRDRSLRLFSGGRLLLARRSGHGQGASRPLLPPADEPRDRCQVSSASAVCYKSGDVRANSHPHLAAMHTLWAREHNRLAEELAELNPQWDDETIFQEARRIVIAEMQHITYDQWLPAILGSRFVQKVGLNTPDSNWYRENMDPSVSNAFATVGLRFGLSMMQGRIQLFDEERRPNASLLLRDHFNKPNVLEDGSSLDGLVRGLATQSSQQVDTFLVEDLTNMMYLDASERGVDALSLAIQRGRDHGLPSYNQYRKLCGLPQAKAFVDFADVMSRQTASRLGGVYAHPDDVDVLVGGMAERPWEGALVGPTLRCVISEQLLRSRRADRYFFDNPDQPYPLSP
ncbi:hypothetical protein FOCC_FOCC017895, partial [Frankliniella occidentalis]